MSLHIDQIEAEIVAFLHKLGHGVGSNTHHILTEFTAHLRNVNENVKAEVRKGEFAAQAKAAEELENAGSAVATWGKPLESSAAAPAVDQKPPAPPAAT